MLRLPSVLPLGVGGSVVDAAYISHQVVQLSSDKQATRQVLTRLPLTSRKAEIAKREIAFGNFQTNHQKATWNDEQQDECGWCGQPEDTRQHRLFFCSAFSAHRDPYQDLVDHELEHGGDFAELPVVFKHPHYEFFDAVHMKMPQADIDVNLISRLKQDHDRLGYYTDGSCKFPGQPSLRYAAFSVVVDLAQNDQQRRQEAALWRSSGVYLPTLVKLCVTHLQGHQSIHRAEAAAILSVLKADPTAVIYSDSACSLQKCWDLQSGIPLSSFFQHADFDQVCALHAALTARHSLHKIKAHVDPHSISDDPQHYHTLGNTYADTLAQQATRVLHPELINEWQQRHDEYQVQQERYMGLCHLILDLQTARASSQMMTAQRLQMHISLTLRQCSTSL